MGNDLFGVYSSHVTQVRVVTNLDKINVTTTVPLDFVILLPQFLTLTINMSGPALITVTT